VGIGPLLHAELSKRLHGKLIPSTIERLSKELVFHSAAEMRNTIGHSQGGKTAYRELQSHPKSLERIQALTFLSAAHVINASIARLLERYARGCVYIGPSRVVPERFYRLQELSVSQLEPHGENLAMFLRSLPTAELADFSEFLAEHIGLRVILRSEGSHVAILLQDELGQASNLIDMGYGFSQVLPVIAQCWTTARRRRASERDPLPTVIAIEQPELHLHPHYQARLADLFVGTIAAARAANDARRAYEQQLRPWEKMEKQLRPRPNFSSRRTARLS
jgi:pimeloyl-ACP methyl ester carboxylesterase